MIAHEGLFFMDDNKKEIAKKLLDLEKIHKVKELTKKYEQNGLINSGDYKNEIGLIDIEYNLKKEQIDIGEQKAPDLNKSSIRQPLFRNTPRYRRYYKLEKIFTSKVFEFYENIAFKIGLISQKSSYKIKTTKPDILAMLKTFNKRSVKKWKMKLKASKDKQLQGLKLIDLNSF